ncbi:MAG: hypothetical protein IJU70_01515 [Lentisphaeria bacterium]|nr:hypothetical protein [Lentisphaeria bacterium]
MAEKIIQSAHFKRNTLTGLAITLFCAIILSEVFLAVSIPWYLRREDAMALEVLRIKMRNSFDGARARAAYRGRDEVRESEMRLLRWALDSMADYLRENIAYLDAAELKSLQGKIDAIRKITEELHRGQAYSREQKLDTSLYLNGLLSQKGKKK